MITLYNVSDTERFFYMVNQCGAPVKIKNEDGSEEDIRNNCLLQGLISECLGGKQIAKMNLHVESIQDLKKIFDFMMQGEGKY